MAGQEHAREAEHDPVAENLRSDVNEGVSESIDPLIGHLRGLGLHLLNPDALNNSMLLNCIHLKYDTGKVNLDYTHINTEGDLINSKSDTRTEGKGRLKKYSGTCSTEPLPRLGCPQYWEADIKVRLHKELAGNDLILEVGLCDDSERDKKPHVADLSSAYSLKVARCKENKEIHYEIKKKSRYIPVIDPTNIPIKEGTSITLHCGIVYDDARKKIVFIDVKKNEALGKLANVDSSQPLWPMFGVSSSEKCTVNMRLVVGKDISMTEEKKGMIVEALSS